MGKKLFGYAAMVMVILTSASGCRHYCDNYCDKREREERSSRRDNCNDPCRTPPPAYNDCR